MTKLMLTMMFVLAVTGSAAAQRTFYNSEFKVGFKYSVTMKKEKEPGVPLDDGFKSLAAISYRDGRRGAGYADLVAATMSQEACGKFGNDSGGEKPRWVRSGQWTYQKDEWVDGGMETVQPHEVYRLYHSGVCYEFDLKVPLKKYGKDQGIATFRQLRTLLPTLYFRK